ncbi:MAG TPA: phosphatase PAP2 family protein [Candidatus Polarisedimenticolia bacterium]|nr:phosphatase PAP2 family protein [Candidatus Polarisedimenticolia bacterium]
MRWACFAFALWAGANGVLADEGGPVRRRPASLLEAARSMEPISLAGGLPPPLSAAAPEGSRPGWLLELLQKHRYHFLSVALLNQAEYEYGKRVGPPDEPLLFGSPGSLDQSVYDRFGQGSGNGSFLVRNKTNVLRAVALGAMLASHGRSLEALGDDVMGLVEADKFNWAASGLVKTIVGRRRPSLDQARLNGLDPDPGRSGGGSTRGRGSFYSDSASSAFTYMAYTDSVLARRFEGRPWARTLSAAGLYGMAGYIAYSRVEQGRHYLTDVVAGAGAGFLVGKIFHRINHRDAREDDQARRAEVTIQPVFVDGGAGVGVSIRY